MIRRLARRILRTIRSTPPSSPATPAPAPRVEHDAEPEEEVEVEVEGPGVAAWRSSGRPLLFVDIREPHEINHGHIRDALIIPMNQIPDRIAEIPADRTLVVYCAAGVRSFGVAHYLREQGRDDAWSLVGGIGAWIDQDESAWHPPPSGATFKTAAPARLSEAAAARLGRDGARTARAGSIQEARSTPDGIRYVLGIPQSEGGMERVDGLSEADLEPIGRQPR